MEWECESNVSLTTSPRGVPRRQINMWPELTLHLLNSQTNPISKQYCSQLHHTSLYFYGMLRKHTISKQRDQFANPTIMQLVQ